MTPRRFLFALGAVLALTITACGRFGFGHERGKDRWSHRGSRGGRGMMVMQQDPVARLLDRQAALRLTPAQVTSLIAIDDKLQTDNRPMHQRLAGWMQSSGMRGSRERSKPDSAQMAMRSTMRDSMMTVFRSIRENNWRATSAAYAVLTQEQLQTAAQLESPMNMLFRTRFGGPGGFGPGGGPAGGRGMGGRPMGPGGSRRGMGDGGAPPGSPGND